MQNQANLVKVSGIHLIKITREEKDWLIQRKYLKMIRGQYPDLAVGSRNKKSKNKTYYVNENLIRFLPKIEFIVK